MNCIKCGKDTKSERIFCQQCLDVMEKYPVKADIHVQLPNRDAGASQRRTGKKRLLTADDQILALQKKVRRQTVFSVLLFILLAAAVGTIVYLVRTDDVLQLFKH